MATRSRLDDLPREQVEVLYCGQGLTTRQLAVRLGTSKSAAFELIKRLDLPRHKRGRKKPRPTREQVYEAIVVQRVTMKKAALMFGFSLPILTAVMSEYGIRSPYWIDNRPSDGELRRMYTDAGMTIREIGALLGYTYEPVRRWLIEAGVSFRPHAFQPLRLPVKPELDGCWSWQGARNRAGYGRFVRNGFIVSAHRWVYTRMRGPIPEGLVLDHLCYNPPCVNPDHLEPVAQDENLRRSHVRRRRLRKEQHDALSAGAA